MKLYIIILIEKKICRCFPYKHLASTIARQGNAIIYLSVALVSLSNQTMVIHVQ